MRAVWSFWTKPYQANRWQMWVSERHHWLSWVLSVQSVKQHYPVTSLVTDTPGARLLVDRLGLEFDTVSTELDGIGDRDPEWWALGKMHAHRLQEEPFFHIDSDAFLWQRLDPRLESAPVLAQNPEPLFPNCFYYHPEAFEEALRSVSGAWLPVEWLWYRHVGLPQQAACCGIVGGNHVEFLRYYAETAIRLVDHAPNQPAWQTLDDKAEHTMLFEQYLLSACAEYHRERPGSPYRDVRVEYLFSSMEAAFDEASAGPSGFTHLLAGAKGSRDVVERLERRVRRDYPDYYDRAARCAESRWLD